MISPSDWRAARRGYWAQTSRPNMAGLGLEFGYNAVVDEELGYAGSTAGITLQSVIVANYIECYGSEEQKQRYLPKMVTGDCIAAIAMTEPGTGLDLQNVKTTARRDANQYVFNGSKAYITNGQNADLVIVVAKTDLDVGAKGVSLILVDSDTAGSRGEACLYRATSRRLAARGPVRCRGSKRKRLPSAPIVAGRRCWPEPASPPAQRCGIGCAHQGDLHRDEGR